MEFFTSSDLTLKIAFWSGILATIIAFAIIIQIILLKIVLSAKAKRRGRIITLWQPILAKALHNIPTKLPALAPKDMISFMVLWNRMHTAVRGAAKRNLNTLARQMQLPAYAFQLLNKRSMPKRLLAVVVLGNLRDTSAWSALAAIATKGDSLIALAASYSLVQIDAEKAVKFLLPLLCERKDWFPVRSLSLLREAGPDAVSLPLEKEIQKSSRHCLPRFIRFLETAHQETASRVVHRIMTLTPNEDILIEALRQVRDGRDIKKIRRCLNHPSWPVRAQAASSLGRIAAKGDERHLINLLQDSQWWVRYRSAKALAQLPFLKRADLRLIMDEQHDNFARDIMRQVMAEEGLS